MAKQFFKDLPDTTTPLTASRLNGLLDGEEALGNIVVDSIRSKNLCNVQNYHYLVNASGTVTSNDFCWDTIVDTRNINSLYISGNFSLLADGVLRIGGYSTYPVLGSTGTRHSLSSNGALNTTSYNYVLFSFLQTGTTTKEQVKNSFQIEKGNTGTTYMPFQELGTDNFKNEEIVVGKIRSKNLINKNKSIRNIGTFHSALSTGVRVTLNVSAQYMWSTFELPSNLLGKIITISSTITPSASNNGKAALFFGNSSNDPVGQAIASLDQTGSVTTTIPTSFPNGTNKIILLLYGNVNGTGVTNNYVDYTNLQVEEGSNATNYMPYQDFDDKEIYLTEETVIGTFLGKPLYRKVIEFTVSDTTQMTIPHGISNLSWVTKSDVSIYNQYGFYMASSKDLIDVNFDINYIYFTSGWPTGNAKIIMEYTKN